MNGDLYPGWEQYPRRRNSGGYGQDQEFGRRRHGGGSGRRNSGEYGRRGGRDDGDYYPEPDQGYGDSGWHDVHPDPRGATDPYGGANPYQGADPYGGEDPYQGTDPYGGAPRGGHDDYYEPYADRGRYPPEAGYQADDGYGQGGYGGHDEYGDQGWDTGHGGFGDQDRYADPGYGRDGYPAQHDEYGQSVPGYPAAERYATADDDPDGWGQDGVGPRDYEPVPRSYRGDAGDAGPAGGRRSGRAMEVQDDRHSGFFSGFGEDERVRYQKPRRRRGVSAGMIALIAIFAMLGGAGYAGYHFYRLYQAKHMSYSGNGHGSVTVLVKQGETGDQLGPELVRLGVVGSQDSWASYLLTQSTSNSLQPGEYRLHLQMGNAQAWAMLTNAKYRINSTVTIVDGQRLSVILAALAKESKVPLSQFQSAIKDTAALGLPPYASGNPEGYLYPDTYDIVPGSTTALSILKMAVHQFNLEATKLNLAAGARRTGFTEAHIIIGASLLEAEVPPRYYADVAEVIDNRLNSGMTLGLDSTVAYATKKYIYNLSSSDLKVNSPYNTFTHAGLPPGPIDSPDAAAIEAFLHPSTGHNWTYFVTINKQGLTRFTNSVSQFDAWSQLAKQNGV
jgi:UPF0755 protein